MMRPHLLALSAFMTLLAQDRAIAVVPNNDRRVALLVGNDHYAESPLKNAVNDARTMGMALQDLGFEVTVATDADRRSFDGAIGTFIRKLGVGSVGFFFYAGHGVQLEGENYLLPVDFKATSEEEARYSGIPIGLVHDRMLKSGARLSMVVLDACRDNPFRTSRGTSRGLAPMNAGKGSFLAFATAPGQTASDIGTSQGGNGLFTGCLLELLRQPDLDLEDVFKRTRERVVARSQERQIPWTSSSVVGTFVFRDLATQERQVAEEKGKLETELARLLAEKAANQKRLGLAESQRREQEVEEQIRKKAREEKRLSDERDQRSRLQSYSAQAEEAARQFAVRREQQQIAERMQLAELKQKLERETASHENNATQSLSQARLQVDTLTAQNFAAIQGIQTERQRAGETLAAEYKMLSLKLPNSSPKDEFETSAQYKARMAEYAKGKADLDLRLRNEEHTLAIRYQKEAEEQSGSFDRQIQALNSREFPVSFQVELQKYEADQGIYDVILKSTSGPTTQIYRASLKAAPEKAKGLKLHADFIKGEGIVGLDGTPRRGRVVDSELGLFPLENLRADAPRAASKKDQPSPAPGPNQPVGRELTGPARVVNQVAPISPLRAAQMRWDIGNDHYVRLKVFVGEQGQPLRVSLIEGVPGAYGFDEAAIDAANKSTYEPATKDGKPVRGWTPEISYRFPKKM